MLVLGLVLITFALAGVAVDGTRAFITRRALQNAADSAALAGAAELDQRIVYSTEGRAIALDPRRARRVAVEWLARRGLNARATVLADVQDVTVELRSSVATTFLGLVGIPDIPVGARATAQPVAGTIR